MYKLIAALILIISGMSIVSRAYTVQGQEGKGNMSHGVSDSLYTIHVHNLSLTVDREVGGRVTSLKIEGRELLTPKKVHPNFYGSTLWLSPEGKWKGHGLLDNGPYEVESSGNSILEIKSQQDLERGFELDKQFSTNSADTSFVIRYTITNILDESQTVAPWEVTRVPTGGLAFFPKGEHPALPKSDLTIKESMGMIWYPYDSSLTGYQKLFINGDEGWQAHVQDGFIFIKQFPEITPSQAAPGEENVEIYVNPRNTYVELENQGAYERLVSKESLTYTVKWYVRRLPADINSGIGSKSLIAYVRNIVNGKKAQ